MILEHSPKIIGFKTFALGVILLYCFQVIVSVGGVYSSPLYQGVMFQVAYDITRKKKTVCEVLATGGRYDHLVSEFNFRATL